MSQIKIDNVHVTYLNIYTNADIVTSCLHKIWHKLSKDTIVVGLYHICYNVSIL